MAAYTSAKLEVTQTATGVVVKASLDPNDDPTAQCRGSIAPAGTQLTTSQAPGTVLGPVRAIVKALDLAGADLPLEGQLVVAAPGQIPAATVAAVHGWCDASRDLGHGADRGWTDAAGPDVPRPDQRSAGSGSGPRTSQICLPPPDVPVGTPGRGDVRREGLQRRAHDQRRLQPGGHGRVDLFVGARTHREPARRTPQESSSRRPQSHPAP